MPKPKTFSIAIDGNEANVGQRVGSNVYAFEILRALEELTSQTDSTDVTVFLTDNPVKDMPKARTGWKYQLIKPRAFATQYALPLTLYKQKNEFDVFFTPGHYAPRFCPIPYVTSVMDLAFLEYPKQFKKKDLWQLKHWTKYSVKKAKQVVTISEFSKHDIHTKYKVPLDQITVAYPSIGLQTRRSDKKTTKKVLKKFGITQPYFLYVGTLQPRKNLIRLVQAFDSLLDDLQIQKKKNRKLELPQLILAGKIGWLADDIVNAVKKSKYTNKIKLIGYVTEAEKASLYQGAIASVLIGLYEGFGMPALESLTFETLPIVSNTTSLPEVVGKAGIQVDPENIDTIKKGLDKALHLTKEERYKYQHSARQQVDKFNWKQSGKKILTLLLGQSGK